MQCIVLGRNLEARNKYGKVIIMNIQIFAALLSVALILAFTSAAPAREPKAAANYPSPTEFAIRKFFALPVEQIPARIRPVRILPVLPRRDDISFALRPEPVIHRMGQCFYPV